jgi:hypothetical protein
MTSAWSEPTGRDDRTDGQVAGPQAAGPQASGPRVAEHQGAGPQVTGPDENQLDMFEILSRAGSARARTVEARTVEVINPPSAKRDFLDVGGPDSDELRRLEDSIRWLMNAGNMRHLPPATPLSPVTGLSPLESEHDDSLILDPEALFAPRAPQRRGDIIRGAAKILLVSAIAAPTAYFVASWAQFPGPAASSDPAVVSTPFLVAGPPVVQVAALGPMAAGTVPEAVRGVKDVAKASPLPLEQAVPALVGRASDTVRGVAPAELKVAVASPAQPPAIAAAPPADPGQTIRSETEAAPPVAIPIAAPPRPSMRPEEVAMMVERGRTLFDAGDIASARLFFRRAANAGDAGAAIAMGATYDPEVLGQRFIRGIGADAREAQKWYDNARALGGTRVEVAHR